MDLSVALPPPHTASQSLFKSDSLTMLENAAGDLTIDQVAALPASAFVPFNASKAHALNAKTALWLHFRAVGPSPVATQNWMFELPKPFVDRVDFYYRNTQGAWARQQSGDWVPQAQWALRGLHPQFYLPELSAGENNFYVKISQLLPLRFDVTLKPAELADFHQQNALLANGLLLGLMIFVSLFALVLGVVYRSKIYSWYAAYVLFAFLAVASYVGVGYFAFWPHSTGWAEMSHTSFLMLGMAAQVQFCSVLFLNPKTAPRAQLVLSLGAFVMAVIAVSSGFMPSGAADWRISTTLAVVAVSTVLMLAIVLKAAFEGRPLAWLWMLAYAPVLGSVGLTLVEQFGLLALPWLPYNTIVIAVAFEVLVLLIALHLHVKSYHEGFVRQSTLVELDPLTGFLAPLYFPGTLAQLWSQARHQRQDIAVAYVRADIDLGSKLAGMPPPGDELVLRCVRMLRMVTRRDDTVARIGGNVYAILMPGVSAGSSLAGKLSRLVALGVMRDSDEPLQPPVRFRIAASTFSSFCGTSAQLDEALKKVLAGLNGASDRTIEFVRV